MAAKETIDIAIGVTAVAAPWWWVAFAQIVNVWVPPVVAIAGLLLLILGVVEKWRAITRPAECPMSCEDENQ